MDRRRGAADSGVIQIQLIPVIFQSFIKSGAQPWDDAARPVRYGPILYPLRSEASWGGGNCGPRAPPERVRDKTRPMDAREEWREARAAAIWGFGWRIVVDVGGWVGNVLFYRIVEINI